LLRTKKRWKKRNGLWNLELKAYSLQNLSSFLFYMQLKSSRYRHEY